MRKFICLAVLLALAGCIVPVGGGYYGGGYHGGYRDGGGGHYHRGY